MALTIEAVYENGVLKLDRPLPWPRDGSRVWITVHTFAEKDRATEAYGLIGWTGDAETVERVSLDPEFDIWESP